MLINIHALYSTHTNPALATAFERVGGRGVVPSLPSGATARPAFKGLNKAEMPIEKRGLVHYSDAIGTQVLPDTVDPVHADLCFYWNAIVDWELMQLRGYGIPEATDAVRSGAAFLRGILSRPPLYIPDLGDLDPLHPCAVIVTSTYHPVPLVGAFTFDEPASPDGDCVRESVLALELAHTESLQSRQVSFPTLWDAPPLSHTTNGMIVNATQPHTDLTSLIDRCLLNVTAVQ